MAYFLATQRLGFRSWQSSDLPLAQALWGDPEVARYLAGPFTPQQIADRLDREIALEQQHGIQYWPIFELATGAHLGCAGLRPYRDEPGVYALGYHLHRAFWGKGFAVEAAQAAVHHAFTALHANGLFAGHHPENLASSRVLLKLGFRFAGMQFYEAFGFDEPTYRLTLAEWRAQQPLR
jgi:[ribosomal protein S5]-alanine N-acetyltransferase